MLYIQVFIHWILDWRGGGGERAHGDEEKETSSIEFRIPNIFNFSKKNNQTRDRNIFSAFVVRCMLLQSFCVFSSSSFSVIGIWISFWIIKYYIHFLSKVFKGNGILWASLGINRTFHRTISPSTPKKEVFYWKRMPICLQFANKTPSNEATGKKTGKKRAKSRTFLRICHNQWNKSPMLYESFRK